MEEVEEELALMMISSRHPFPAEEEAEAEEALHHFFLASLPVLLRVEGVEAAPRLRLDALHTEAG